MEPAMSADTGTVEQIGLEQPEQAEAGVEGVAEAIQQVQVDEVVEGIGATNEDESAQYPDAPIRRESAKDGAFESPVENELTQPQPDLAEDELLASAESADMISPEPELTPLEATAVFRDKYIESCMLYECEPVPLLLQIIEASLEQGEPVTAVVLNGNSKFLFNKRLTLKQVHALANAMQLSRHITELHLCYNFLDDKAAEAIAQLMKVNRTLATVALDGNDIGPAGAKLLSESLAAQTDVTTGLTSLKLTLNPLGDEGGMYIAQMLRRNRRLKHLFISGTHMGMPSVVAIAAALQESNTTLEILDISNSHAVSCHDEPAISFSNVLARHPRLWALSLSRWRMNDYGLENLITASHAALQNQTLRYLDLSCNRLTEVSGKFIARLIAANTPLETLRLGCNELHDNAAYEIANALMDNSMLGELDLSFNGLTDGALQELAQGVTQARALSSIRLWGNFFGPGAAAAWGALLKKREELEYPLHCDFKTYVVDGVSYVAKVTEE